MLVLKGELGLDHGPAVESLVWIEQYARWTRVLFLCDASCPTTIVAASDIDRVPLPLDDKAGWTLDDRSAVEGVRVAALLSFFGEDERFTYHVDLVLTDVHSRSRLGWDVLGRWLSEIDADGGTAMFEPQSWDGRSLTE